MGIWTQNKPFDTNYVCIEPWHGIDDTPSATGILSGKKQIVSLQAAVWNTQLLMKHGNANYLEVLSAQKNLLQAELTETADRLDEIRGVINLYYALGGGYTLE